MTMHSAFQGVLLGLHTIAVMVWVGGLFGKYVFLRTAANELDDPSKLLLWRKALQKFFPWMSAAMLVALVTGYAMVFTVFGGLAAAPLYINLMQVIGVVMIALFVWLFFVPWREFNYDIEAQNLSAAIANLKRIEKIVLASLLLGIIAVAINSTGAYW